MEKLNFKNKENVILSDSEESLCSVKPGDSSELKFLRMTCFVFLMALGGESPLNNAD
ncbi:MAG: hypothetical protein IKT63_06550 [Oscillospiraceae bacterium]|nr:hypothetical protein [Oscillospiraceae bacterium]